MFAIYAFCREVDDIADEPGPTPEERRAELDALARRRRRPLRRRAAGARIGFLGRARPALRPRAGRLPRHRSTAWRWTSDEPIIARRLSRRSTSTATGWPARSAGCRCKVFGMEDEPGVTLAHHLGRALQLTNILRDLDEDADIGRLYLPREALDAAGIDEPTTRPRSSTIRASTPPAAGWPPSAHEHYARGRRGAGRAAARAGSRTPRLMSAVYASDPDARWRRPAGRRRGARVSIGKAAPALDRAAPRPRGLMQPAATVYVIGAGLAGLSAAVRLAGRGVRGRGAARPRPRPAGAAAPTSTPARHDHRQRQPPRPVRQPRDPRLSARASAPRTGWPGRTRRAFDFCDVARRASAGRSGPTPGPIALVGVLARPAACRAPRPADYLGLAALALPAGRADGSDEAMPREGAALGPADRALPAGGAQHRPRGRLGRAGRRRGARDPGARAAAPIAPRIAHPTLAAAFVDPAARLSRRPRRRACASGRRLRGDRATDGVARPGAQTDGDTVPLADDDAVILATPPWIAPDAAARPDRAGRVPRHRQRPLPHRPAAGRADRWSGVIGGAAQWVFAFADRISVTVSGADALVDADREALAAALWADVATVLRPAAPSCRPGRSSRSGAPPSPPRPSRTPSGPQAPHRAGATCSWPATGPIPACPPPSRARSARATRPPSLHPAAKP